MAVATPPYPLEHPDIHPAKKDDKLIVTSNKTAETTYSTQIDVECPGHSKT